MSFVNTERTEEQLVELGSVQWTKYPGTLPGWVAESDFGLAGEIKAALTSAVERELTGYPPMREEDELRIALSGWLRSEFNWEVDPRQIVSVGDAIQGYRAFVDHFTPAASPVVVTTPAYAPFHTVTAFLGREVIEVPMAIDTTTGRERHVFDLDGIRAALRAGGKSVVLCNPANPSGRVFTADELTAFANVVGEFESVRVFADEVHSPITLGATHIPFASVSPIAAERAITVHSASKGWNLAGLKCAQIVFSNPEDIGVWEGLGMYPGHGVSTLGIVANIAAYTSGRAWLSSFNKALQTNREVLMNAVESSLPAVKIIYPEGTYLAWMDFRTLNLPEEPADYFLDRARVSLYAGTQCGRVGTGHARFRFSMPADLMVRAIERLAAAI